MTEKIYDTNPLITQFEAKVLSCTETPDGYAVILDKSAFFPEEGGQDSDSGTINGINVLHVAIDEENVLTHLLAEPVAEGETVTGHVDWDVRFDRMQQHAGEHILSGLIHSRFGYDNVGFHLSRDYTTFDINGTLTDEEILAIEKCANEAVHQNLPVRAYFPTPEECASLSYRCKTQIEGTLRLVEIKDTDLCACCAPHVASTGQIGIIKIIDFKSHRGGMRFTILCGMRALKYAEECEKTLLFLQKELSAPFEKIPEAFLRMKEDGLTKQLRINDLQERLLKAQIAGLPSPKECPHALLFTESMDRKAVRNLINSLTEQYDGYSAVFTGCDDEGYSFIAGAGRNADCTRLAARLKEELFAKCGGDSNMIQGSVKARRDALEKLFS